MRKLQYLHSLMIATALTAAGADDTTTRLEKATDILNKMTQSGHDIRAGEFASADCIVVIPGFKKGAIVVGVGHGRGFISCRNAAIGRRQARLPLIAAAWAYSSVAKK
jgi:CTP-dependent riboflavin kinase